MSAQQDLFTDPTAVPDGAIELVRREFRKAVYADRRFPKSNRPGEPRVPTAPVWQWLLDTLEEMDR